MPAAVWADGWRTATWFIRGLAYGARNARRRRDRAFSGFLLIPAGFLFPVAVLTQWRLIARPAVRYYFAPDKCAVIAIRCARDGWDLADHSSRHPKNTPEAAQLRRTVIDELLPFVDDHQITLHAVAAVDALAELYMKEIPGLRRVGRAWPRGIKLRRDPNQS